MRKILAAIITQLIVLAGAAAAAPQNAPTTQTPPAAPAIEEWGDDFDGDHLDATKWEPYTFDGGGGKIEVKDKQLKMHGTGESRSGVRSKRTFSGERFYVEAVLTKVGNRPPRPGEESFPPGFAIVTILFDGNPMNRLEWIQRSDGNLEAWQNLDGRMIRVDSGKLATKEKNPRLGIARRGEQVYFMLNGQIGLERTIRGMPSNFKVMLYGFGSSQNDWDAIKVQTLKQ